MDIVALRLKCPGKLEIIMNLYVCDLRLKLLPMRFKKKLSAMPPRRARSGQRPTKFSRNDTRT